MPLHNEVHARPSADVDLPALVVYVAVLNEGVSREQEHAHLCQLPSQQGLAMAEMAGNFLRLTWPGFTVKWERHTEFTRYSIVQPLPQGVSLKQPRADLLSAMTVSPDWLSQVPGQTFMAMALAVVHGDLAQTAQIMSQAQAWLGARDLVQSQMGNGEQGHPHSCVLTDLQVNDSGFERLLVIADAGMSMSPTRAGRIVQRLLELETYRLMALRGLPVAKQHAPQLTQMENGLAEIAASLEHKTANDKQLLDTLVALAVQVEKSTAQHMYRFGATRAYEAIAAAAHCRAA